MVEARLERLDAAARRVLRAASIFGQTFWKGAATELLGGATDLDDWLAHLVDAEIISKRSGAKFAGEEQYAFRHGLRARGRLRNVDRGGSRARAPAGRRLARPPRRARRDAAGRALRARRQPRARSRLLPTRSRTGTRRQRSRRRAGAHPSRHRVAAQPGWSWGHCGEFRPRRTTGAGRTPRAKAAHWKRWCCCPPGLRRGTRRRAKASSSPRGSLTTIACWRSSAPRARSRFLLARPRACCDPIRAQPTPGAWRSAGDPCSCCSGAGMRRQTQSWKISIFQPTPRPRPTHASKP